MKNDNDTWKELISQILNNHETVNLKFDGLPLVKDEIPIEADEKYLNAFRLLFFPCTGIPYLLDLRDEKMHRFVFEKNDVLSDKIVNCKSFPILLKIILGRCHEDHFEKSNLGYFTFNVPYKVSSANTRNFRVNLKPLEWTAKKNVWLLLLQIEVSYKHDDKLHLLFYDQSSHRTKSYEWATEEWIEESYFVLSNIEKEIMLYAIAGYKSSEIAQFVPYTQKSIERFRYTIFEKLGVDNISEAIDICEKHHLLDL